MKRFWILLTLVPLAVSAAVRDDYARQWPLTLGRDDAGAYRITLDEAVYRQARDRALRDVVVVNHDGQAVAADVFIPEEPLARPPARIDLPWFALPATPGGAAGQGWELVSQADTDGRLRRVEARITDTAVAALPRSAVLIDVSRVREAIVALELHWQPVDALDLGYSVEASDDLEHWQPLATRGRLVDLQREDRRLLHRRIELYGLLPHYQKARYLRLTPDSAAQPLTITGVQAELAAARAQPAPSWLELRGVGEGREFSFELPGRFPVQWVDVAMPGNHAVEWRLESRDDADAAWQLRAGPWMAYQVGTGQVGTGGQSPARVLDARVRDRHWRLRASAPVLETPTLRLGYRPEVVVFLAQGAPPFALAAGSTRAARADSPIARLVADLRKRLGKDWQPAPAYLGASVPLAGDAAVTPQRDWKTWLLWSVLGLGALVIAGFAVTLLRVARPPGQVGAAPAPPGSETMPEPDPSP
ncbi:DUF3999 domain-containing protein [Lysobacter solisilvae]|uniref:DUF3999 domain-containing protein n=2 Tax=Agrilutibacter solisilvae TaxID=2763317 RepID=A0A974Y1W9_9GAMM|nr:DUF3999 domain-containing protein [Lysobacter solisilvae]